MAWLINISLVKFDEDVRQNRTCKFSMSIATHDGGVFAIIQHPLIRIHLLQ